MSCEASEPMSALKRRQSLKFKLQDFSFFIERFGGFPFFNMRLVWAVWECAADRDNLVIVSGLESWNTSSKQGKPTCCPQKNLNDKAKWWFHRWTAHFSASLSFILNDLLKDGFTCLNLEEKLILNIFLLQSVRAVLCSTLRRAMTVLNVAFRSMKPTHWRCSGWLHNMFFFSHFICFFFLSLACWTLCISFYLILKELQNFVNDSFKSFILLWTSCCVSIIQLYFSTFCFCVYFNSPSYWFSLFYSLLWILLFLLDLTWSLPSPPPFNFYCLL